MQDEDSGLPVEELSDNEADDDEIHSVDLGSNDDEDEDEDGQVCRIGSIHLPLIRGRGNSSRIRVRRLPLYYTSRR